MEKGTAIFSNASKVLRLIEHLHRTYPIGREAKRPTDMRSKVESGRPSSASISGGGSGPQAEQLVRTLTATAAMTSGLTGRTATGAPHITNLLMTHIAPAVSVATSTNGAPREPRLDASAPEALRAPSLRGSIDSFRKYLAAAASQNSTAKLFAPESSRTSRIAKGRASGFAAGGSSTVKQLLAFRRGAAIATLAAPLLTAPALTAVSIRQRGAEPAPQPSITINSAPTVVINNNHAGDLKDQVLAALKQHSDTLYEQLHREMRRRQRTEF
jgi:hypothetical protein